MLRDRRSRWILGLTASALAALIRDLCNPQGIVRTLARRISARRGASESLNVKRTVEVEADIQETVSPPERRQ